ncbi:hypothetical protein Pint_24549 [Pistacia integerrima]|uniref:Uncharacterized protein n=1 Tax=Pistacia integerrima TaxID=434235 RepID=A0ACC0YB21_9ROSI|nr:hypothetical protein Pint_24549 [Pistacia integerrima]
MDFQTREELCNILVGAHEHENLSFATAKEMQRILGSFGYHRAPDGLDEMMRLVRTVALYAISYRIRDILKPLRFSLQRTVEQVIEGAIQVEAALDELEGLL